MREPTTKRGALPAAAVYAALFRRWGPQRWWPARSRAEMIIGAILTQNTAWPNVERAIARLRAAGALRFDRLHAASPAEVESWIRPAGTYRVKAHRLRAFATMLHERHGGSLDRLLRQDAAALRRELLGVSGIGPETADCIVLYAARRPVFVVDAYTRRMLERHGWAGPGEPYDAVAARFTAALDPDPHLFNEFHALIVQLGKAHCRARPRCAGCPLAGWLAPGQRTKLRHLSPTRRALAPALTPARPPAASSTSKSTSKSKGKGKSGRSAARWSDTCGIIATR